MNSKDRAPSYREPIGTLRTFQNRQDKLKHLPPQRMLNRIVLAVLGVYAVTQIGGTVKPYAEEAINRAIKRFENPQRDFKSLNEYLLREKLEELNGNKLPK